MDTMAHALLVAAAILDDGELDRNRDERYAGWDERQGLLDGDATLQQLHDAQLDVDEEPTRVSGRQEALENLVARHIDQTR